MGSVRPTASSICTALTLGMLCRMTRETLSTTSAPGAIGPYSQAVKAEGSFLFLSGQIPLTPAGELVRGSIAEQTVQCIKNIEGVLESAGLTLANIVKTTIFLSSMDHFLAVNEAYGSFFTSQPPARSTVAVAGLPRGVDVEIEAIAVH
jgi:2-iminobutanoate/2-iminopropanoate deaminase